MFSDYGRENAVKIAGLGLRYRFGFVPTESDKLQNRRAREIMAQRVGQVVKTIWETAADLERRFPQSGCFIAPRRIDLGRTAKVSRHGQPPRWQQDHFGRETAEEGGKHTTHIAAVDAEGNWVAITATVNTSFGSKVIVPGTGVVLNNQMDDFSIAPGTPNAYGLLGGEANAVAAGKRPLSSMSPTIVLEEGRPILTLGAAGGPTIITQVVQTIIHHLDLGKPLPAAVAAPRIHHQWMPDVLRIEESLDAAIVADLKRRGHAIRRVKGIGVLQAIAVSREGKTLIGVHDPRVSQRQRVH